VKILQTSRMKVVQVKIMSSWYFEIFLLFSVSLKNNQEKMIKRNNGKTGIF